MLERKIPRAGERGRVAHESPGRDELAGRIDRGQSLCGEEAYGAPNVASCNLVQNEYFDSAYAEGLQGLIRLGNEAAYGARVEPGATAYAQQLEPRLRLSLDDKIARLKEES